MNTSAPGWLPDPGGRHEYRYWNGTSWTNDVATNGVTSVDPPVGHLPPPGGAPTGAPASPGGPATTGDQPAASPDAAGGPGATAVHGAPTAPHDAVTGAYGPPTEAYDAPTVAQGPQTATHQAPPGYGPSGAYPVTDQGMPAPAPAPRSGPPKGLLIGIGALAVALIAGVGWALTRDDGDDTAGDDIASVDIEDPADGGTADDLDESLGDLGELEDELGDLEDSLGDMEDLGESFGDLGTGSVDIGEFDADLDLTDPADVDEAVEQMVAAGVPEEMARCSIENMIAVLGAERLDDISRSSDPDGELTPEETNELVGAMMTCAFENMDEMEGLGEPFGG
jgi:hypothetical protein